MEAKNYELLVKEAWKAYQAEAGKNTSYPTILLAGCTGAGKSSLMNYILRLPPDKAAKVGGVKPVTDRPDIYSGKELGVPLNIIDMPGYELEDNVAEKFMKVASKLSEYGLQTDYPQMVWYCVSVAVARIEPVDVKLLEGLLADRYFRKRVCVVFTKCDQDDANGSRAKKFKSILEEGLGAFGNSGILSYFETSTEPKLFSEMDFKGLMNWSERQFDNDEDMRRKFIAAQQMDLDKKKKMAEDIILKYAAAAGVVGAVPIPFADAPLLVAGQTKMSADLFALYGIEKTAGVSTSLLIELAMSNIGKRLVLGLLKFIPGAGQIAAGMVNATVASGATWALGKAISEVCCRHDRDVLNGKKSDISKMLDNVGQMEQLVKGFAEEYSDKKISDKVKLVESNS